MKKKIVVLLAVLLIFGMASTVVLAASDSVTITPTQNDSPAAANRARGYGAQFMASVVSKITGLSLEEVLELRAQGQNFYQIAVSKGISAEEFKEAVYKEKAALVDERVKEGYITQEQGQAIKENMRERINNCNGLGNQNGYRNGLGIFGMRYQRGNGNGLGSGRAQFGQN
ncbi:MAG: hypothetical protein PWP21_1220 [Thermosediminibacterales bacterium]|nr:hypothetical protein [Thermosediminibacterales bacterium]